MMRKRRRLCAITTDTTASNIATNTMSNVGTDLTHIPSSLAKSMNNAGIDIETINARSICSVCGNKLAYVSASNECSYCDATDDVIIQYINFASNDNITYNKHIAKFNKYITTTTCNNIANIIASIDKYIVDNNMMDIHRCNIISAPLIDGFVRKGTSYIKMRNIMSNLKLNNRMSVYSMCSLYWSWNLVPTMYIDEFVSLYSAISIVLQRCKLKMQCNVCCRIAIKTVLADYGIAISDEYFTPLPKNNNNVYTGFISMLSHTIGRNLLL